MTETIVTCTRNRGASRAAGSIDSIRRTNGGHFSRLLCDSPVILAVASRRKLIRYAATIAGNSAVTDTRSFSGAASIELAEWQNEENGERLRAKARR